MTDTEYHEARYRILEDFYNEVRSQTGLPESVRQSLGRTRQRFWALLADASAGGAR